MHCPFSIRVLRSLALIALAALVSCLSHSEQQPELSSDRPPTLRPRSPIAPGCICMLFRAPWDGWGATVATRFFGVGNVKRVRKGGSTWGASRSRRRAISFPSRPPRPPLFSPASLSLSLHKRSPLPGRQSSEGKALHNRQGAPRSCRQRRQPRKCAPFHPPAPAAAAFRRRKSLVCCSPAQAGRQEGAGVVRFADGEDW